MGQHKSLLLACSCVDPRRPGQSESGLAGDADPLLQPAEEMGSGELKSLSVPKHNGCLLVIRSNSCKMALLAYALS